MKIKYIILATFLGFISLAGSSLAEETKKPLNVLFILADDLGIKDLGCYGSSFYDTPHLDALAKDSTKYTNAYAACPVCSPTRSSIMTGHYPARTKNTNYFGAPNPKAGKPLPRRWNKPLLPAYYLPHLPHKLVTLPEALKEKGYATFFAGKWHLGSKQEKSLPTDHGFDINIGGWKTGGPYGGKKYFSPYGNPYLKDGPAGEHLPDRLATETIKFINETDKPFFAMLSFYSVHTPLIGRQDLINKYKAKAKKLTHKKSDIFKLDFPKDIRTIQDHAIYGAMVEAMDEAIGKLIKGLKASGKYDNTLIIFFSDNGGHSATRGAPTANTPYRAGKGWLYEGGIKEPFILRIPGVTQANTVNHSLVTSTDFYPTILEACKFEKRPADHVDGISILNQKENTERPLFWHFPHWGNQGGIPGSVIRQGDWKLIKFYYHKTYELYNIKEDPSEKTDLFNKHPEVAKKLKVIMENYLKETNANYPTVNPNFKKTKNYKW